MLEAANQRFLRDGYESTTGASIAADAGVSERTFFRYFPTKADVLIENWKEFGEDMRKSMSSPLIIDAHEAVTTGLLTFVAHIESDFSGGLGSAIRLYRDPKAFLALIQNLLGEESAIADEIARRTNHSSNQLDVRIAANASMGVVRASIRSFIFSPEDGPTIRENVRAGMNAIAILFHRLAPQAGSEPDNA